MSIKIASMNFGDCDTIMHNTPNGMKNIAEVLGPNGEVYWNAIKELTSIPPLSIRSNGTMLLDYLISGNMSQTASPTPTTPIQPQETGDMSSNLWSYHPDTTSGGVRLLWDGEKINYSNTCTRDVNLIKTIDLKKGTYTLKANANRIPVENDNSCIDIYHSSSGLFKSVTNKNALNGKVTFTLDDDLSNVSLRIRLNNGTNYDGFEIRPMLNIGETSLPYDVYGQYKIPISSANTTTPIYLGEVQTTRRIRKVTLTGNETFTKNDAVSTNYLYFIKRATVLPSSIGKTPILCNELPVTDKTPQSQIGINTNNKYAVLYFNFGADVMNAQPSRNTPEGVKEYLSAQYAAGTPVTIWYVLATPTTGIVNEPLRKIGDYADTVSYEQAGVQIPTNRGNTVIDVDTTLKPSQMYIKYR